MPRKLRIIYIFERLDIYPDLLSFLLDSLAQVEFCYYPYTYARDMQSCQVSWHEIITLDHGADELFSGYGEIM